MIRQLGSENVAAFIAEPVVGAALGAVSPPDEYFPIIREICDRYDVVFVADEVMTGFGRTGEMFGMDNWRVKPDIMACAKGISGGYVPLGAVIAHERILDLMEEKKSNIVSGHTYSAHHLIAAVAKAVIKYTLENDLVNKAKQNGLYLMERMGELLAHPLVGDVRGKGLFGGVEFVRNRETKEPFSPSERIADRVGKEALERGLIIYPGTGSVDGIMGDHILVAPPLTVGRSEIDEMVSLLEKSVDCIERQVDHA
jgi:adenosylmethionine-8-amino-7-oxononanoate aminotransferase